MSFLHFIRKNYNYAIVGDDSSLAKVNQLWEEDREKVQRFYNHILGNQGEAPFYCEPWVANQVIKQHLYSPSMWAIFPIQDLLAMDGELRRVFPEDEHINRPEIIPHYWRYRLHLNIEDLLKEEEFNDHIKRASLNVLTRIIHRPPILGLIMGC